MSYDDLETSVHSGAPVELYRFIYQGQFYYYTSATRSIVVESQTYNQAVIDRAKIAWTTKLTGGKLLLDVAVDFPMALLFDGFPPESPVILTILRLHITDVDVETVTIWTGRVRGAAWEENKAVLTCDNLAATLNKTGPRLQFQYMCNHVLYGDRCGVAEASFSANVVLYSASGIHLYSVAIDSYADGWFDGGYVRFNNEYRMITSHVGEHITITVPFSQIMSDATVRISAGCSHTFDTCVSKFANYRRYGGYPFVPNRNPFIIGL